MDLNIQNGLEERDVLSREIEKLAEKHLTEYCEATGVKLEWIRSPLRNSFLRQARMEAAKALLQKGFPKWMIEKAMYHKLPGLKIRSRSRKTAPPSTE